MCPTNEDVDTVNLMCLAKVSGDGTLYEAINTAMDTNLCTDEYMRNVVTKNAPAQTIKLKERQSKGNEQVRRTSNGSKL
ncbi:hypothetical protein DIPPA_17702 [Diplonema papillatum]|nr:hypothetical protein DIPPA_17702 [Diplonema papillatum]